MATTLLESIREELQRSEPALLQKIDQYRDGSAKALQELRERFSPETVAAGTSSNPSPAFNIWQKVGLYFLAARRVHEALGIFSGLYDHLLSSQEKKGRVHKGDPLLWMMECYVALGCPALARRHLMLTLCEDAIGFEGKIDPNTSGLYFRMVWMHGFTPAEIDRLAAAIYSFHQSNPEKCLYPDAILQELGLDPSDVVPSAVESYTYRPNVKYLSHLIQQLGDKRGIFLELVAQYMLACIPGCRVARRVRTRGTEFDLVCSMIGPDFDFRSEFGRYFVCECKDLSGPADFTTIAKLCRVLDSVKGRFGILFSNNHITGKGDMRNAENEQMNVFHDRGIVVVVVDRKDIESIAAGGNFIELLRKRYEEVRLNIDAT